MDEFNRKFVGEVKKFPEVYDNTRKDYSRKSAGDRAWAAIAKRVKLPVQDCKDRWRNLRTTYGRHIKLAQSGSGMKAKRPYYLNKAMQFAAPFIKTRANLTPNLNSADPIEMGESSHSPGSSPRFYEEVRPPSPQSETRNADYSAPVVDRVWSLPAPSETTNANCSAHVVNQVRISSDPLETTKARCSATVVHRVRRSAGPPETTNAKNSTPNVDQDISLVPKKKVKLSAKAPANSGTDLNQTRPISTCSREEGLKCFLYSLMPDLLELTDRELRVFKRKALTLIDTIWDERRPSFLSRSVSPSSSSRSVTLPRPSRSPRRLSRSVSPRRLSRSVSPRCLSRSVSPRHVSRSVSPRRLSPEILRI